MLPINDFFQPLRGNIIDFFQRGDWGVTFQNCVWEVDRKSFWYLPIELFGMTAEAKSGPNKWIPNPSLNNIIKATLKYAIKTGSHVRKIEMTIEFPFLGPVASS